MWAWLERLFRKSGKKKSAHAQIPWPTRDEIAALPPFAGLTSKDIVVVTTAHGAQRAYEEVMWAGVVGFDTESKPTFVKGHVSTGPHVVQFATLKRAYVFILHHAESREVAGRLIASPELRKVGFGLRDDLRRIPIKLKVTPAATLDLETVFTKRGYGRGVGVKVAVAIVFKRRFMKSKRASTSNWMNRELSEKQLLYAANDAYAAIRVFHGLTSSKGG